ncbi:Stemmadenine O-acetyltransferase [Linum grandiflorum]
MEIQTISRCHVRPSSPTPPNLKTYNLSGIDQINPSLYGPFIFFYPADPTQPPDAIRSRSFLLKRSLSHILSRYYPLAGKLRNSLSVDCCDTGAYYSEAKIVSSAISSVSQFLDKLDLASLRRLLPIEAVEGNSILSPPPPGSHLLLVQETRFPSGGIAIGLLVAHDLLDAFSIATFLLDWSAAARTMQNPAAGKFVGIHPQFVGGAIFPQNEALFERLVDPGPLMETPAAATVVRKRSVSTRRFVFRAAELARLKDELTVSTVGKDVTPSRVQAVTALLCSSIIRAFKSVGEATSSTGRPIVAVTQAVNLRRKANPQLPSNLMGNYIINAVANLSTTNNHSMEKLVNVLRDSVSKMNAKFVEEVRGEKGKSRLAEVAREEGIVVTKAWRRISFTSWSRLGFYEVDFGWGKPVWFGCLPSSDEEENVVVDLVMILDTRDGSGLEAWVFLEEDEMAVLEYDELLLSFASLDPNPFNGRDNNTSLSKTLTLFYPLAGKTTQNDAASIHCTDDGAYYVEARVLSHTLTHYLKNVVVKDMTSLKKLLPLSDAVRMFCTPPPGSHVALFQVTFFPCGGLAIGSMMSHKIVDAPSFSYFFQAWAAAAAAASGGSDRCPPPLLSAESVFPQSEAFVETAPVPHATSTVHISPQLVRAQTVAGALRRFVFNASAITRLKEKSKSTEVNTYPSRVQAVTALIIKVILRAFESRSDTVGKTAIVQPVNLRTRANPPLPRNLFGNLIMRASFPLQGGKIAELDELVSLMKGSVSKFDGELMRKIQWEGGKNRFVELARDIDREEGNADRHIMCNSFSRLGYYEIDFGWGKPVWSACFCPDEPIHVMVNMVLVNDTASGEGLEAWVVLGEDDMRVLENDEELLSFVSAIDPSPLDFEGN